MCYCRAPARCLWSRGDAYAGGMRGVGLRVFGGMLRRWDQGTAANVTEFLANSTHTAREIARCYGREARVVFPPVRLGYFTPLEMPTGGSRSPDLSESASEGPGLGRTDQASLTPVQSDWAMASVVQSDPDLRPRASSGPASVAVMKDGHWLAVGALESYKRFDLAIGAAREAGARLVIVGTGSDEKRLRAMAGEGVEFLGRVGDERLRELYRSARLLLFPQVEDFGIVAVEAQACGCPVVARRAGGALDTVIDGVTGAMFEGATVQVVLEAVGRVPARTAETTRACRVSAERFGEGVFAASVLGVVRRSGGG